MDRITVLLIESKEVKMISASSSENSEVNIIKRKKWDPGTYLNDETGQRLIEEICRRVEGFWRDNNHRDSHVLISLPGTLKDEHNVISSSRLGIRTPVNVGRKISERLNVPCYLLHDAECISMGEIKYGNHFENDMPSSIVCVFVDEGIGSKIFIDGKMYNGAGTAGLLGRLIVDPDGAYYPALRSNGALEVYSSRPWVSKRLVEVYHCEHGKKHNDSSSTIDENSKFRQALATASSHEWDQISYERMAEGVNDNDPIAIQVIERATKYLGYSINAIITLINPYLIILGGAMITQIPGYAEKTINYSRQFSWPNGWNKTDVRISNNDRDFQIYGAIDIFYSRYKG